MFFKNENETSKRNQKGLCKGNRKKRTLRGKKSFGVWKIVSINSTHFLKIDSIIYQLSLYFYNIFGATLLFGTARDNFWSDPNTIQLSVRIGPVPQIILLLYTLHTTHHHINNVNTFTFLLAVRLLLYKSVISMTYLPLSYSWSKPLHCKMVKGMCRTNSHPKILWHRPPFTIYSSLKLWMRITGISVSRW